MLVLTIIFLVMGVFGFIPDKSLSLRLSQEIFSDTTLIFFIAMFLIKNIWIKSFLVLNLLSLTMVSIIYNSSQASLISRFSFMTIFVYLIGYQVLINNIKKEHINKILDGICIIALIQCLLIILQKLNIWIFFVPKDINSTYNVACGFLGNTNISGSFLALCIPAFLRKKWKWYLIILLVCLFINKCLGAVISCVVGLIFYFMNTKFKYKYFVLITVLFLSIIYYIKFDPIKLNEYNSLSIRLFHWKQTFNRLILKDKNKFFYGWGIGQYKVFYPMLQKTTDMYKDTYPYKPEAIHKQAHNEFIQLFAENGLIGLVLALCYIISLFIRFIKNKNNLCVIIYTGIIIMIVNSCVHFLFHTTTCIIALIYMSIFEILTIRRQT